MPDEQRVNAMLGRDNTYGTKYSDNLPQSENVQTMPGALRPERQSVAEQLLTLDNLNRAATITGWKDYYAAKKYLSEMINGGPAPRFPGEDEEVYARDINQMLAGKGPALETIQAKLNETHNKLDWHTNIQRNPINVVMRAYGWPRNAMWLAQKIFSGSNGENPDYGPHGRLSLDLFGRSEDDKARDAAVAAEDNRLSVQDQIGAIQKYRRQYENAGSR